MRYGFALLLVLAACDTPHPTMFGAQRHEIALDGIRFVVFQKEGRAEVLRMGYLSRGARAAVPALMQEAAERTTGCGVVAGSMQTRLPGDTGEAVFTLDC